MVILLVLMGFLFLTLAWVMKDPKRKAAFLANLDSLTGGGGGKGKGKGKGSKGKGKGKDGGKDAGGMKGKDGKGMKGGKDGKGKGGKDKGGKGKGKKGKTGKKGKKGGKGAISPEQDLMVDPMADPGGGAPAPWDPLGIPGDPGAQSELSKQETWSHGSPHQPERQGSYDQKDDGGTGATSEYYKNQWNEQNYDQWGQPLQQGSGGGQQPDQWGGQPGAQQEQQYDQYGNPLPSTEQHLQNRHEWGVGYGFGVLRSITPGFLQGAAATDDQIYDMQYGQQQHGIDTQASHWSTQNTYGGQAGVLTEFGMAGTSLGRQLARTVMYVRRYARCREGVGEEVRREGEWREG